MIHLASAWQTTMFAAGNNNVSQLGIDSLDETVAQYTGLRVGGNITQLALGLAHGLVVLDGSRLYGFGDNRYTQLGVDNTTASFPVPTEIPFFKGLSVVKAAAGEDVSAVLTADNKVYTFGTSTYGRVGRYTNDIVGEINMTKFPDTARIVDLQMRKQTLFVQTADGDVYAAGNCAMAVCGRRDILSDPEVLFQLEIPRVAKIWAEEDALFYQTPDGKLYGLGYDNNVKLCSGATFSFLTEEPVFIDVPGVLKQVSSGNQHSLFLTEDGKLYGCGYGANGQLGNDTNAAMVNQLKEVPFKYGKVQQVQATEYGTIALAEDTIYAAGRDLHGELAFGAEGQIVNHFMVVRSSKEMKNIKQLVAHQDGCFVLTDDSSPAFINADGDEGMLWLPVAIVSCIVLMAAVICVGFVIYRYKRTRADDGTVARGVGAVAEETESLTSQR